MPEVSAQVRSAAAVHTDGILDKPQVIGVGVALKQRGGEVTDEQVVVAFVSRKLPSELLTSSTRVPERLETDGGTVGTDVVEVPEPRLLDVDTRQYRPLVGGCQIGTSTGTGTLGGIFYDRTDHRPVLLTNNHVLTATGNPTTLPSNTQVTQAAGGPLIGMSKRVVPMFSAPLGVFDYRFQADVDAGIVAPTPGVALDFSVLELGPHPFLVQAPVLGQYVHHRGFRTQLRDGTVETIDLTIHIKDRNGATRRIGGPGIGFSIRAPLNKIGAWPGDSGSLAVDAGHGAALGLVFGGNLDVGGLTFACDLRSVMDRLNLETACSGGLNALIRRAVFRRYTTAWSGRTRTDRDAAEGVLVTEMVEIVARFRRTCLSDGGDGSVAGLVDGLLRAMAVDLTEALQDEDAAGLLDRAFGEWLTQPTVFDLLEYRFPESFAVDARRAWDRLRAVRPSAESPAWVDDAIGAAAGRSVRELLGAGTPRPRSGLS